MRTNLPTLQPTAKACCDLLNDHQTAELLGVLPRTLRLWRNTRGLPHIRLTSKVIRYRRPDIDGWIAKHYVATSV